MFALTDGSCIQVNMLSAYTSKSGPTVTSPRSRTAPSAGMKLQHGVNHPELVERSNVVVKGQSQQAVAHILAHGAIAFFPSQFSAVFRKMQRQIVEHARNAARFQV